MPPAGQSSDLERCAMAQRYVIKGSVTARTAIRECRVMDQEDVRLIREFAARRDIDGGMLAPRAIRLNDVDNEADDRKLRVAGARRAVRQGSIAPEAVRIHGVSHGDDRADVYRQACSRDMAAGASAIEAAQRHLLRQEGFIFGQMASKGASFDLGRGKTAEQALERNGVRDEGDTRKVFRSALEKRKAAYLEAWSRRVRADQEVAHAERSGSNRGRKPFQPVYYQPVAAFVDLDGMGATPMITAGKTGPEIVAELKVTTPSHVVEIKRRCAARDFAGENASGDLAGKQVSALHALLRNKVEHRDDAQNLLGQEVERELGRRLARWVEERGEPSEHVASVTSRENKRPAETLTSPSRTKIRRLSPSVEVQGRSSEIYEADLHARAHRSGRG